MPRYATPSGKKENKIKIGGNLRKAREEKNKTQVEVCRATGLSEKNLSCYETNKIIPPVDVLIKLSKYYGMTLDYLVLGEDVAEGVKGRIKDTAMFDLTNKIDEMSGKEKELTKEIMKYFVERNKEKEKV